MISDNYSKWILSANYKHTKAVPVIIMNIAFFLEELWGGGFQIIKWIEKNIS